MSDISNENILNQIFDTIESRKNADPKDSYVASLFEKRTDKIAEKVGEEAIEAIIEAVKKDSAKLTEESADLIFHLMILWSDAGLKPNDIFEVLKNRNGISGHVEKANRTK